MPVGSVRCGLWKIVINTVSNHARSNQRRLGAVCVFRVDATNRQLRWPPQLTPTPRLGK
jgi:hypothetical protein